jgi:ABC-type amino acid transport substrate-binding protein
MKTVLEEKEQFVIDAAGRRVGVLLGVRTYDRLREAEDELADIRAYDAARPKAHAELRAGQTVSLAEYRAMRNPHRK